MFVVSSRSRSRSRSSSSDSSTVAAVVVVVVVVTISEVQGRKKRRYKRENFGGTSDTPTPSVGFPQFPYYSNNSLIDCSIACGFRRFAFQDR